MCGNTEEHCSQISHSKIKHVAQCMICKSAGEESGTEGGETCWFVALKSGINWNSGYPCLSNLFFSSWLQWGFIWEFRHFQDSLGKMLILVLITFPCCRGMGCCSQQRARLPLLSGVFRQFPTDSAFPWAPLPAAQVSPGRAPELQMLHIPPWLSNQDSEW